MTYNFTVLLSWQECDDRFYAPLPGCGEIEIFKEDGRYKISFVGDKINSSYQDSFETLEEAKEKAKEIYINELKYIMLEV